MPGDRILVTGAGGFIGRALTARLAAAGIAVRGAFRRPPAARDGDSGRIEQVALELPGPIPDPGRLFADVGVVVHLAAHVHVQGISRFFPGRFHEVNATGTLQLARRAAAAGVERFVLMSSIGVNGTGGCTGDGAPRRFTEDDAPCPDTAYARSKLAAEEMLRRICAETDLEYVILRAPLVFGPGVGANFRWLLRAIHAGLPVPIADPRAVRSMSYVENLVDVILRSMQAPAARNALFLVADFDVAIPDLIGRLAAVLGRPGHVWRCPAPLLDIAERLPAVGAALRGLTRSHLIDSSRIRAALQWSPQIDLDAALTATAQGFAAQPA